MIGAAPPEIGRDQGRIVGGCRNARNAKRSGDMTGRNDGGSDGWREGGSLGLGFGSPGALPDVCARNDGEHNNK